MMRTVAEGLRRCRGTLASLVGAATLARGTMAWTKLASTGRQSPEALGDSPGSSHEGRTIVRPLVARTGALSSSLRPRSDAVFVDRHEPDLIEISKRPTDRSAVLAGVGVAVLCFGGLGTWAATAPLSSAAVTTGTVRADTYRKTVQHMEGGIIREIFVQEGQMVAAGQLLVRMDDTQARAAFGDLRSQYIALLALEARLIAERDQERTIAFPRELEGCRGPEVVSVCKAQQRLFTERERSFHSQIETLTRRMHGLRAEIDGRRAQVESLDRQLQLNSEEMKKVRPLVQKGVVPVPRLLALEQFEAAAKGNRGEQLAQGSKAEQTLYETRSLIAEIVAKRQAEVAESLSDAQTKLAGIEEKLRAAEDIQRRTEVVAPEAGKVVNLRHVTPGGVLKAGEAVLDLVPQDDRLIVEARVRPDDIAYVYPGLRAEVRLTAYSQRYVPAIRGSVYHVSADRLADSSNEAYYAAFVELEAEHLAEMPNVKLYPGMPAEVLLVTGERTALQYLTGPIRASFNRAFREQ